MAWKNFFLIWAFGASVVLAQGIASWFDGYLTQAQLIGRGITNGWSFLEHGGMWADALIISPLLGYVLAHWEVGYDSRVGDVTLILALALCVALGYVYQVNGIDAPDAHTHGGRTTIAGFIHGLFALFALWTISLVYLGATSPTIPASMLMAISSALTPFCVLGVMKFSDRWSFDRMAMVQVAAQLVLIWGATIARPLLK